MAVDVAQSPLPEGVERYAGEWIALRDGEVIAHAETLEALTQDESVVDTDVLYRVPERGSFFY
jgi:hypothetical protein